MEAHLCLADVVADRAARFPGRGSAPAAADVGLLGLCALPFYLATDALAGFFRTKEIVACLNK